ncbi:uncharacterized protein LOC109622138 [Aedes albopictus]|uniref:Uncharacterized protein n=1 Tax=Aedes albopictus TaxID=7160 RepID=A0ABM2A0T5_AEDAL
MTKAVSPHWRHPLKEVWNAPGTSSAAVAAQSKYFTPERLEALLSSTLTGQDIRKRGASGPLSTDSQRELVQILTEHHCNAGKRAKEECLAEYAECIVALFKYEKAETYYIPRAGGRKNPGGKLYNKIVNSRQKAAKRKLREEAHLAIKKPATSLEVSDESAVKAVEWLKYNKLPWTTALDKWEQAYPLRKSQLGNMTFADELLNRHSSVYQDPNGYQAIASDFISMYGNTEGFGDGIERWKNAFPKLVQYLDRPYKDEFSKSILESLKATDTHINTKNCSILLLLNNILKPTKNTRNFKPSVLVAQEEVI